MVRVRVRVRVRVSVRVNVKVKVNVRDTLYMHTLHNDVSHLYVACNELRSPGLRPEFKFPNEL